MKILVLGADGFIGSKVKQILSNAHDVHSASRSLPDKNKDHHVDLTDKKSINQLLSQLSPDVIINCAGVVDNTDKAGLNPVFTSNLLEEIVTLKMHPKKIIILGSAGEYGLVKKEDLPVKESAPLNASSNYALSKLKETTIALKYKQKYGLPIVIARIFNPVGAGMPERLLLPNLIKQVGQIKSGKKHLIELSRLDAQRDYIDVGDVANAIKVLVENDLAYEVYNIGSGKSISTQELVDIIVRISGIPSPTVVETSPAPEDQVASQADITRIKQETQWSPTHTLEETIKGIVDESK